MLGIGKKDMLDRRSMAIKPLGRNNTYEGFNM